MDARVSGEMLLLFVWSKSSTVGKFLHEAPFDLII